MAADLNHMAGHDHAHRHATADNQRNVFWAMVLTGGFMLAEVVGGVVAGSLALIADAGHMLTDAASLGLAWAAFRRPLAAGRPPDLRLPSLSGACRVRERPGARGHRRLDRDRGGARLFDPVEVLGGLMLAIAALGLLVNLAAFAILRRGDRANLNVQGAVLHVLADLLGSVAAIVAALVIVWTGWAPIDPLLSLLVAALILNSAWRLLRKSAHILLEGAPDWLDDAELRAAVTTALPTIQDVHHVHAWMLTSERPLITLHAEVAGADHQLVLASIQTVLRERFGIDHATIQIETAACTDP